MDAATDLMSISLPACERVFARQPSILEYTLSEINWKAALLEFPKRMGRPR
jgi:hypothetical protein